MKNAIGYIRVSTKAQGDEDKYGIEAQKQAIEAYASENGFAIVKWLTDKVSGVSEHRPEWDKILYSADVVNPPFEAVIVFKSDRVARDIKLYFYYLFKLEQKGVNLLSTQENFDEGDGLANVYRALILFCAEQERKNIALRTSNGRKIKAVAGGHAGGRAPYGYACENARLVVNEGEAIVVRQIFEMDKEKLPFRKIANKLNEQGFRIRKGGEWTSAHCWYIINNRKTYEGYTRYGDCDWVKGVHTPLVEEEKL